MKHFPKHFAKELPLNAFRMIHPPGVTFDTKFVQYLFKRWFAFYLINLLSFFSLPFPLLSYSFLSIFAKQRSSKTIGLVACPNDLKTSFFNSCQYTPRTQTAFRCQEVELNIATMLVLVVTVFIACNVSTF